MLPSADIIKKIRVNLGMEQGEFAEKIGVSKAAISNYEKGLRTPRLPIIRRMKELGNSNGLNYKIEDFLDDGENK